MSGSPYPCEERDVKAGTYVQQATVRYRYCLIRCAKVNDSGRHPTVRGKRVICLTGWRNRMHSNWYRCTVLGIVLLSPVAGICADKIDDRLSALGKLAQKQI